MKRSASQIIRNLENRIARLERQAGKGPFVVTWYDPNNHVEREGGVEYKGKFVFNTLREAEEALEFDRREELDMDPDSEMTWSIQEVPKPRRSI